MIHPSYTELKEAINANSDPEAQDTVLDSRYSLVLATSRRARQLIAGAEPLVPVKENQKPLSIAIDELYKGKVKILPPRPTEEDGEPQSFMDQVLNGSISDIQRMLATK
ncbi:MAG: DNA-directed RNA polymerase subunit omega [Blautia sp.]|nr:DNA-directed RNA polymerase subunit omega [Blautia sp.]